MSPREHDALADDEDEIVDALPVPSGEGPRRTPPPVPELVREPRRLPETRTVPMVQAAAVVATGFAAGAVTAAVVRGVTRRRAVKAAVRRPARPSLPIVGSRSFLVDVHLLGPRD